MNIILNRNKFYYLAMFAAIFMIVGVTFYVIRNIKLTSTTKIIRSPVNNIDLINKVRSQNSFYFKKEKDSTYEGQLAYIENLDATIESTQDKNEKSMLLLNKVLASAIPRETTEVAVFGKLVDNFKTIRTVYDQPKEGKAPFVDELSIFTYMYLYVMRCFPGMIAGYAPQEYTAKYIVKPETYYVTNQDVLQEVSFYLMSDMMYDKSITTLRTDKAFLGNRIYILATFVDSYYEKMTPEYQKEILNKLADDLESVKKSQKIYFTSQVNGDLLPAFYVAYGNDVYLRHANQNLSTELNTSIDKAYEDAQSKVDIVNGVISANAIVGAFIDQFYIRSLVKRYGYNSQKEKIDKVVTSFEKYSMLTDTSKNVVPGFYAYYGTKNGGWTVPKKDLFAFAKANKKYGDILVKMGIKI